MGGNIFSRDKVLTSNSGKWSKTPVKHIRENNSLKGEATEASNKKVANDRGEGDGEGIRGQRMRDVDYLA